MIEANAQMLDAQTLIGTYVKLEPLSESHRDELYQAAQDAKIWQYTPTSAYGEHFAKWFNKAITGLQSAQQLPFVVRQVTNQKVIGSTRYYEINLDHKRLTIGYTWYVPAVWGTKINPECKYLLLQHAFEVLQVNRVEFAIDARNVRSCAAVKKIGATEEGVLRSHMVLKDGVIRDTVILSITKIEWPKIETELKSLIARK